jgi:hypothetical protein
MEINSVSIPSYLRRSHSGHCIVQNGIHLFNHQLKEVIPLIKCKAKNTTLIKFLHMVKLDHHNDKVWQ